MRRWAAAGAAGARRWRTRRARGTFAARGREGGGGERLAANRVLVGGRVARSPEHRVTPAGTPVVIFGLSLGPGGGEGASRGAGAALRVMARGALARDVGPRLVPGLAVYVEGRLVSRLIESRGARRLELEVDAEVIECLEERPNGAAPASGEG